MRQFDAIIIGAGQAGPSLAGRLTAAGMTVALVERKLFGGTCVNTGCTPTRTLIASAHAAHLARRAADFGVLLKESVQVDMKRVKARAEAVVEPRARQRDEIVQGSLGRGSEKGAAIRLRIEGIGERASLVAEVGGEGRNPAHPEARGDARGGSHRPLLLAKVG